MARDCRTGPEFPRMETRRVPSTNCVHLGGSLGAAQITQKTLYLGNVSNAHLKLPSLLFRGWDRPHSFRGSALLIWCESLALSRCSTFSQKAGCSDLRTLDAPFCLETWSRSWTSKGHLVLVNGWDRAGHRYQRTITRSLAGANLGQGDPALKPPRFTVGRELIIDGGLGH